jgi:hypothetical protein
MEGEMCFACGSCGGEAFRWANLKEGNHLVDTGINDSIILKYIFNDYDKTYPCKSRTGPEYFRRLRLSEFLDSRHMRVVRFQPHAPTAFTRQEIFLVLISVRG